MRCDAMCHVPLPQPCSYLVAGNFIPLSKVCGIFIGYRLTREHTEGGSCSDDTARHSNDWSCSAGSQLNLSTTLGDVKFTKINWTSNIWTSTTWHGCAFEIIRIRGTSCAYFAILTVWTTGLLSNSIAIAFERIAINNVIVSLK